MDKKNINTTKEEIIKNKEITTEYSALRSLFFWFLLLISLMIIYLTFIWVYKLYGIILYEQNIINLRMEEILQNQKKLELVLQEIPKKIETKDTLIEVLVTIGCAGAFCLGAVILTFIRTDI